MGFRAKLILSYIAVVLISFGTIAFFLDKKLEERSLRDIEASLTAQAALISDQIASPYIVREDSGYLEPLVKRLGARAKCRVTLIAARGKVLADSEESLETVMRMDDHGDRPEVRAAMADGIGINMRFSPTLKIKMLYVALPVRDKDTIVGIVRLALPLESVEKTLWSIRKIIAAGLIFAMCLAIGLGSVLSARTIQLINRMIAASRRFSDGDFRRRVLQPSSDEIGELAHALNRMAQDIEDKIGEVRAQNQRLEAIFSSMVEGVLVVDRTGRIVSANPAVERIFAIRKTDAEGRLFLEAIRNTDIASVIHEVLKKGAPLSSEISLVYPVRRTFQINAIPLLEGGAVSGCLAVIHDITEMRRLEIVRSDFVANVSHELKTPLTSIKGFVETLLEGALEDRENGRAFLKIIHDHTDRLDKLVNDLLTLSHLESKEIALQRKDFRLSEQIDEIILGFGSQTKKSGIGIRNEAPRDLSVRADRARIDQVITNLIDNAVKFNKAQGLITIRAEKTAGAIKVTVEDSGIGIPAKEIPRIFERFYRVDKARSRDLGGTGLGLSIVKHIVELHGGTVGVESSEGFGSKFWFTLPL